MKWPVLFIALVAIPLLAGWLRQNPGQTAKVWILMGVLLFVVDPLHLFMAVVSWPLWPGFVKGAEVSIIDVMALAIFISLPRSKNPLPFRISIAAYFLAVMLSVFQAGVAQAAVFYVWQLGRMFLLYVVVARASKYEQVVYSLLKGVAIGLCIEVCVSLATTGIRRTPNRRHIWAPKFSRVSFAFCCFPLFCASLSWPTWLASSRCSDRRCVNFSFHYIESDHRIGRFRLQRIVRYFRYATVDGS